MKICFVQKQIFPYFGVMAVSAQLKQCGHQTDILIDVCEKDIVRSLRQVRPDLIGFSVLSSEHVWLERLTFELKKYMPAVPIVVGGVHAILYPDDVLALSGVDYVCRGEGESAFIQLTDCLTAGKSPKNILGISYKDQGRLMQQGIAPLTQQLDGFFEDRHLYYERYPKLGKLALKVFMSSRGCPYLCSFCANSQIMRLYQANGNYVRRKSPQHFIEEIKRVVEAYPTNSLFFADDLFALDLGWLEEFCFLYKQKIKLPYICTARIDMIKEKHGRFLAESGCHTVSFGVETGNQFLRQVILKKNISNEQIFESVGIIKKAGIKVQTSNMFCLPDETVDDAVATLNLNIAIGTSYMFTTVFLPFPKTELAQYCINRGLLKENYSFVDMPNSFIQDSVLRLEHKDVLLNIHKIAHLCVRFPLLKPCLIMLAKKIKFKQLFLFFWLIGTFIRFKEERQLSLSKTMRYLWEYRWGL